MGYTFGKNYKLCNKRIIQSLFDQPTGIKSYPFVCKVQPAHFEDQAPFKIVISVPKRLHRSAVQRNKIRRVIKESIRLNKHILENHSKEVDQQFALFLIYTSKDVLSFELMNRKTIKLLNKVTEEFPQAPN